MRYVGHDVEVVAEEDQVVDAVVVDAADALQAGTGMAEEGGESGGIKKKLGLKVKEIMFSCKHADGRILLLYFVVQHVPYLSVQST